MVTKKIKYTIVNENNHDSFKDLKITNSYNMASKSKFKDGIDVNKITIVDNELIQKTVDKKINKRFKSLLELIASICESDDDPTSGLNIALTETDKFKREMINKYNRLLEKKEIELINKKIELIEKDLKIRLYEHQLIIKCQRKLMEQELMKSMEMEEEVIENHRRR